MRDAPQNPHAMRRALSIVLTAACVAAVVSCSRTTRTTNPAQTPQNPGGNAKTPAPKTSATATPSPTAPPPVMTPTPGASPRQIPVAPKIAKKAMRLASDAAPQILAVAISETTVQPGDRVSGSVVTSSNVASVEARIGGYAMTLSKVGVGRFALTYTVAPLPWFVRGNFTMQVIARNTRGDATTRAIPLTVR
ncbi:MAG TPA: hypothetical protein VGZ06_06460 [Candidatus Cybelea sp.]|nr:hypothetical protein [Candidatus Cybelea sp.]